MRRLRQQGSQLFQHLTIWWNSPQVLHSLPPAINTRGRIVHSLGWPLQYVSASASGISWNNLAESRDLTNFQQAANLTRWAGFSNDKYTIASPTLPKAVLELFAPDKIYQDGSGHVWLNKPESAKDYESPWTVVGIDVMEDLQDGRKRTLSLLLHRLKAIQQRVPQVNVVAIQQAPQADVESFSDHLVRRILQHYVTFPVLVFYDAINKAALFDGAGWSPISCLVLDQSFNTVAAYSLEDLRNGRAGKLLRERLVKAKLARLNTESKAEADPVHRSPAAMIGRGPDEAEDWPNLLLSFPSHITADFAKSRLFVSNALNHQVLMLSPDGTIQDVIGLSRTGGYQDGPFETALLRRPGGLLYEAETETLLIADVENHAIRRADLRERTLTTLFPKPPEEESVVESLWSRFLPAFLQRPVSTPSTFSEPKPSIQTAASEEIESARPWFPWHIAIIEEGVLAVASAGYGQAWTVHLEDGTSKTWMDGGAPNVNPKLRHGDSSGPNDDVSIVGLGDLLRGAGEAARSYSSPLEGSFLNHAKCRMIYKTEWREICQVSDDLQSGLERDAPEA